MGRHLLDIIIVLVIAVLALLAFVATVGWIAASVSNHHEIMVFLIKNDLLWLEYILAAAILSMIAAYCYEALLSKKVKITSLMIISFLAFGCSYVFLVSEDFVISGWVLRTSIIYALQIPFYVLIIYKLRGGSKNKVRET